MVPVFLVTTSSTAVAQVPRVPIQVSLESQGFRRVQRQGDIVVFHNAKTEAVAAEVYLRIAPSAVLRGLLSYDRQVGVLPHVEESRVLRRGSTWLDVYQRIGVPIVSDRDYLMRVRWGVTDGIHWLEYRERPAPKKSGIVRMPYHRGSWQWRADQTGRVLLRYVGKSRLGGSLPDWIGKRGHRKNTASMVAASAQDGTRRALTGRYYGVLLSCSRMTCSMRRLLSGGRSTNASPIRPCPLHTT